MPEPRWFGGAGVGSDGRIYAFGGYVMPLLSPVAAYGIGMDSLVVYDPRTNTWSTTAPMHRGRQLLAAAFGPDGKLYIFGGYGGTGDTPMKPGESVNDKSFQERYRRDDQLAHHALDSVEAYDPKTNTWSERAPMPLGVEGSAAALGADGRIYVVGGTPVYANPEPVRQVQVYDPRTDTWSEGPRLHKARQGHMVVANPDGRIWAIGGTNAYSVFHPRMLVGGDPATLGGLLASVEVLETKPRMGGAAP